MPRTFDFFAPSLQPSTVLDISLSEPGPSRPSESRIHPINILSGSFAPVGSTKRIAQTANGQVVLADDSFRVSCLPARGDEDWSRGVEIVAQSGAEGKGGDVWTGLIPVKSSVTTSYQGHCLGFTANLTKS